ncbi:hypothetical protein J5TS2_14480 [Brevibacillus halotolerans]|nr:hypothetical protein J5TS2_14480 [Brevibacillus halotolerans]
MCVLQGRSLVFLLKKLFANYFEIMCKFFREKEFSQPNGGISNQMVFELTDVDKQKSTLPEKLIMHIEINHLR